MITVCGQVPLVHCSVLLVPPSVKYHPSGHVKVAIVPKTSHDTSRWALETRAAKFRHGTGTTV